MEASYQMGLCCAAGFGIDRSFSTAFDLVMKAAYGGHRRSQAIALRLAEALGIDLSPDQRLDADEFVREAFASGSRTMTWDRGDVVAGLYEGTQSK